MDYKRSSGIIRCWPSTTEECHSANLGRHHCTPFNSAETLEELLVVVATWRKCSMDRKLKKIITRVSTNMIVIRLLSVFLTCLIGLWYYLDKHLSSSVHVHQKTEEGLDIVYCTEDIRDNVTSKMINWYKVQELEDTKGVTKIRKSKKGRQHNGQRKKDKGQTMIYKTYT